MAICKDCICYESCKDWAEQYEDKEFPYRECRFFKPKADVAEVKHGYWIDKPTGRYLHMGSWCSVCQEKSGIGGIESNRHKPYCPNCGAKMDERKEK